MPNIDDEDFIVWMRAAGLSTFRKLYRRITSRRQNRSAKRQIVLMRRVCSLRAGDVLRFQITNVFPMTDIGDKRIVLSTMTWIGGSCGFAQLPVLTAGAARNPFLGTTYIVVGVLAVVLSILFALKQRVSPRRLGDLTLFQWAEGVPLQDTLHATGSSS
jgi:hypothetical protein